MVVAIALGSALAYAVAMVLQQRGAQQADPDAALRPGLLVQLVQQRWWLAGLAANLVAFGLRAISLAHGSLVLVQPVLLTGLFFALLLETLTGGRQLTRRDCGASAALVGGLSLFVLSASPTPGRTPPPADAWLALGAVAAPVVVVLVAQGRGVGPRPGRALWWAAAGGVLLAVFAALIKQTATEVGDHGLGALGSWSPFALIVVGGLALLVVQSAFQAGPLRASLPVLSVVEPLASILVGATVLQEHIATSPVALAIQSAGLAVLLAGAVVLARGTLAPVPAPTPVAQPA